MHEDTLTLVGFYYLNGEEVPFCKIMSEICHYAADLSDFETLDSACGVQVRVKGGHGFGFYPHSCCDFLRWATSEFLDVQRDGVYWLFGNEGDLLLKLTGHTLRIALVSCHDIESLRPYVVREIQEESLLAFELAEPDRLQDGGLTVLAVIECACTSWKQAVSDLGQKYCGILERVNRQCPEMADSIWDEEVRRTLETAREFCGEFQAGGTRQ